MGTAAAGSGQERPGDGVSPGARPAEQITPELPEEQPPTPRHINRVWHGSLEPAAGLSGRGPRSAHRETRSRRVVPRDRRRPSPVPPATLCALAAQRPQEGSPMPQGGTPRSTPYFPAVPAAIDLPAIELEVLQRWQDGKVFDRSLERTAAGPMCTFYEVPPTAHGMPGVHHIEARVFKDVFPRFQTMHGFHVPRPAGWDCHGLPVQ